MLEKPAGQTCWSGGTWGREAREEREEINVSVLEQLNGANMWEKSGFGENFCARVLETHGGETTCCGVLFTIGLRVLLYEHTSNACEN